MSNALSPWPVVQNGSQGHPIRTLQFLLRAHGHNLAVDGIFGAATEAAVKAFQTSKALIIQVKRAILATRFAASKRNSSSVLANPAKGSRWMEFSDRKRTARSEASNTLYRSTFHLSHLAGIGQRHVVGIGSSKYVTTESGFMDACDGRT
jgi:peptidoglycan hydrolase-like protein with peptidoglycan-binding domain